MCQPCAEMFYDYSHWNFGRDRVAIEVVRLF